MLDWLSRRFARPINGPSGTLIKRLADYPPYHAPHVGWGAELSVAAARENLNHFNAALPQRLQIVGELLRAEAGIDLDAALQAPREQGLPLTDTLHEWVGRCWPALLQPRFESLDAWLSSRRAGDDIVLSLVFDVAIVLGELIRRANADWRWDIDLNRTNLQDQMSSARRVVLLADPVGDMPDPFVNDVESVVVARYRHPQDSSYRHPGMNPWRRLVDEGQRGVAMAFWRGASQ
jgi:hypothetical protein